jgi:hypothetical protein
MRRSTSLQGCRQRLAVMPVALVMSAANGVSSLLCTPGDISILRRQQSGVQCWFGQPHVTRIGAPGHLDMPLRERIDLWFEPHCLGKSAPRAVDIALEP